jgi:predicted RNA methylase
MIKVYDEDHPGKTLGPYGETDFHTFHKILKAFHISKESTFYELGSGRGRLVFWLGMVYGQKEVVGVEKHPRMVQKAIKVQRAFHLTHITFINEDWLKVDFMGCDVLYLYALELSEKEMKTLALHFSSLKNGAKIITVNWWFGEVFPEKFKFENKTSVKFPWGEAEVYLQSYHSN